MYDRNYRGESGDFNNKLTMIAFVDNILLIVVQVKHFSHMVIIIPHCNFPSPKLSYLCSKKTMFGSNVSIACIHAPASEKMHVYHVWDRFPHTHLKISH